MQARKPHPAGSRPPFAGGDAAGCAGPGETRAGAARRERGRAWSADRILAGARHFARHRSFYRAMFTGPCGYALTKAQTELLVGFNERVVRRMPGDHRDPELVADLAGFVTAGAAGVFNTWVVEDEDQLDPETFTDRLMRMLAAITIEEPQ